MIEVLISFSELPFLYFTKCYGVVSELILLRINGFSEYYFSVFKFYVLWTEKLPTVVGIGCAACGIIYFVIFRIVFKNFSPHITVAVI